MTRNTTMGGKVRDGVEVADAEEDASAFEGLRSHDAESAVDLPVT